MSGENILIDLEEVNNCFIALEKHSEAKQRLAVFVMLTC